MPPNDPAPPDDLRSRAVIEPAVCRGDRSGQRPLRAEGVRPADLVEVVLAWRDEHIPADFEPIGQPLVVARDIDGPRIAVLEIHLIRALKLLRFGAVVDIGDVVDAADVIKLANTASAWARAG